MGGDSVEFIPTLVGDHPGPVALLATVFLMVMFGLLVPRWVVARLERERDDWKQTAFALMRQNTQLLGGVSKSVDVLETVGKSSDQPPAVNR